MVLANLCTHYKSREPFWKNEGISPFLVEDGEIGIFALNGDAYIKKLQNDEDGLFLISLNLDYAPIPIKENDRLDIFGKVVGSCNTSSLPEYSHKR